VQPAINTNSFELIKMLLTARQLLLFCLPLSAQGARSKAKVNHTNTCDLWVGSPLTEPPSGVTHHTFRSDSTKRDVGYCLYLPPRYQHDKGQRYPVIDHLH
jgi:hypothetical protein